MKKYMVESKKGCYWHYEYFETEHEAIQYAKFLTDSTNVSLYRKHRDGGYVLIEENFSNRQTRF